MNSRRAAAREQDSSLRLLCEGARTRYAWTMTTPNAPIPIHAYTSARLKTGIRITWMKSVVQDWVIPTHQVPKAGRNNADKRNICPACGTPCLCEELVEREGKDQQ